MAVKKNVNPLNYLGLPTRQSPSTQPPKILSPTPSAPIDAASGLVIGSPEYQRFQDQREMKLSKKNTPVAPNATAASSEKPVRDLDQEAKDQGIADASEMARVALGKPKEETSDTSTDKPTPKTKEDYDAEQLKIAQDIKDLNTKRDAFARITAIFTDNNFTKEEITQLEEFVKTSIMDPKMGPEQAMLTLRTLPAYQSRFAGNKKRLDKGMNALSEETYLLQEDAFSAYLGAAGQAGMGTRERYATFIGNAVAPDEVGKRINLAVDNVKNADPLIMGQLKRYFPAITDDKLVSYFLDPTQSLAELNKQVGTAQLGAGAMSLGKSYDSSFDRAAKLFAQVGEAGAANAKETYQTIGEVLEPTQNLTNVYKEAGITYGQTEAESEFFNKNVKAQEDRKRLKSLARGSFQADPGRGKGAFSSPISI
jgi:hypothetical protein